MSRRFAFILASLGVIGLAGCDNDDDDPQLGGPPSPPAPPAAGVEFSQFVKDQFAATADDTDPVPVDDTDFEFSDDPTAYDDLFQ